MIIILQFFENEDPKQIFSKTLIDLGSKEWNYKCNQQVAVLNENSIYYVSIHEDIGEEKIVVWRYDFETKKEQQMCEIKSNTKLQPEDEKYLPKD